MSDNPKLTIEITDEGEGYAVEITSSKVGDHLDLLQFYEAAGASLAQILVEELEEKDAPKEVVEEFSEEICLAIPGMLLSALCKKYDQEPSLVASKVLKKILDRD